MAEPKSETISFAEWLLLEQGSELRHELIDGNLYVMTGSSDTHNLITLQLAFLLKQQLQGTACRVFTESIKLRTDSSALSDGYYPDVMVVCSQEDTDPYYKTAPAVLAEVLSPSSLRRDRVTKLHVYRNISSLQAYLILSQEQAQVELYQRQQQWQKTVYGIDDVLVLKALELSLAVREIYSDVLDDLGL